MLCWLHRLSIGFGMIFGLLFPSSQQIPEFANQQAIESEKTAHRRSLENGYFWAPAKHKQAINYSLVAFDYDLRCCVSTN